MWAALHQRAWQRRRINLAEDGYAIRCRIGLAYLTAHSGRVAEAAELLGAAQPIVNAYPTAFDEFDRKLIEEVRVRIAVKFSNPSQCHSHPQIPGPKCPPGRLRVAGGQVVYSPGFIPQPPKGASWKLKHGQDIDRAIF